MIEWIDNPKRKGLLGQINLQAALCPPNHIYNPVGGCDLCPPGTYPDPTATHCVEPWPTTRAPVGRDPKTGGLFSFVPRSSSPTSPCPQGYSRDSTGRCVTKVNPAARRQAPPVSSTAPAKKSSGLLVPVLVIGGAAAVAYMVMR